MVDHDDTEKLAQDFERISAMDANRVTGLAYDPVLSEYKPPPEQTATAVLVLAVCVLATIGGLVLFVCWTILGPTGSATIIGAVGATWAVSWAIETLRAARQWDRPHGETWAPHRRGDWLSSDEDMERRERERGW